MTILYERRTGNTRMLWNMHGYELRIIVEYDIS